MLKFFIMIIYLLQCCFCYANDWQELWVKAAQYCQNQDYSSAEFFFNESIEKMEAAGDVLHPYVYVDRGRLLMITDRYVEALLDLNKALSSKHLESNDKSRALISKVMVTSQIGMDQECLDTLDAFYESYPGRPRIQVTPNHIIIRNMPQCECYKSLIKTFTMYNELAEKEEDIQMMSNICIIKRCKYTCSSKNLLLQKAATSGQIAGCKSTCDKLAIAGAGWCGKVFKTTHCQIGCMIAVDYIRELCHWCCSEGDSYKKCIKPFEEIVSYMGNTCDPMWD
jgi:hypothetical protein